MGEERVKMVRVRVTDKALRRYSADGIITLPEDQAASEVALGRVEYLTSEQPPVRPPTPTTTDRPPYLSRKGFSQRREGLRVAWVQDFSKTGGAELSNEVVVRVGDACGYDIVGVSPGGFNERVLHEADVLVLNNVHEFTREQFDTIRRTMYERRIPWVKYEHDTRELRRQNISRRMFAEATLAVFLSPAHANAYASALDMPARVATLPLAVDVESFPFLPASEERSKRVLIPTWRKCEAAVCSWMAQHPDREYLVMGAGTVGISPPEGVRVEGAKPLPNARMHEVYHSVGTVVHLPGELWAGERVVLEAKLCGCEVVVNSNVGHASWDWLSSESRDAIAEKLRAAPYLFWRAVERALRETEAWAE